ncbi:MAG: adenylate/guanylate cyclase domain-containing protein [Acidimicrobiia bacterium]|nr:adenylate/guanylate cyclase domain-containing protein [Acidimicrobiia bacterium]
MPVPPSGTVTFLFTDIEGSTRLWDAHPDDMSEAQAAHDRILRRSIADRDGYVFSHAGDGLGASFASPMSALDTALDVQRSLAGVGGPRRSARSGCGWACTPAPPRSATATISGPR